MEIGETIVEYCVHHGYVEHFLGEVWLEDEDCGEALHCCICNPNHIDNPIQQKES